MSDLWTWKPLLESSEDAQPNYDRVEFYGYEQRVGNALVPDKPIWNLIFRHVRSEMLTARQFLRDHADGEAFDFADPVTGEVVKVVWDSYRYQPLAGKKAEIQATFRWVPG